MLSRLNKRTKAAGEGGFTLIELLVVVIIIGILAAIAIPMYLSQREKGWHANAQSDLRNAAVAMESYYTGTNPPTYGGATVVLLAAEGFNESSNVTLAIDAAQTDADGYVMTAAHDSDAGCVYTLDSAVGEPVAGAGC